MSGYYLALDKVYIRNLVFRGTMTTDENPLMDWNEKHTEAKHYYWAAQGRAWTHAIEDADVFPTTEEAEGQALIAVSLDPNVAGHVNVVEEKRALAREAKNIQQRELDEEIRLKQEAEMKKGYKLGRGDGGPI